MQQTLYPGGGKTSGGFSLGRGICFAFGEMEFASSMCGAGVMLYLVHSIALD